MVGVTRVQARVLFRERAEPFCDEMLDDAEKPVAAIPRPMNERLPNERRQRCRRKVGDLRRLCRGEWAVEDGKSAERGALLTGEKVPRSEKDSPQAPVPLRDVELARLELVDRFFEHGLDLRARRRSDPGGGKLDCKRHAMQSKASGRDHLHVCLAGREPWQNLTSSSDEEPHRLRFARVIRIVRRLRQLQAFHRDHALGPKTELMARRHENASARRRPSQGGDPGIRSRKLLHIVEHKEHVSIPE